MNIEHIVDAIKLLFRKDKALYRSFYNILGFYPRDIRYYQEAIMHSSLLARNEKGKPLNNERLEYLGDAVLESVSSDILYRHFPNKREGFLTNARSKLVQRETLGKVAKHIGLDKLIRHQSLHQSHNSYMGGNAFEALMGAIYLDRGYEHCMRFFQQRVIGNALDLDKTAYVEVNFKSRLIEMCQKYRLHVDYLLLEETKDAQGAPYFRTQIVIDGQPFEKGEGYSKRESQQRASKATISRFRKEPSLLHQLIDAQRQKDEQQNNTTDIQP